MSLRPKLLSSLVESGIVLHAGSPSTQDGGQRTGPALTVRGAVPTQAELVCPCFRQLFLSDCSIHSICLLLSIVYCQVILV